MNRPGYQLDFYLSLKLLIHIIHTPYNYYDYFYPLFHSILFYSKYPIYPNKLSKYPSVFPLDCSIAAVCSTLHCGDVEGGKVAQEKYNLVNLIEEMSIISLVLLCNELPSSFTWIRISSKESWIKSLLKINW